MNELKTTNLFSLDETLAKDFLLQFEYPYECLSTIGDFIEETIEELDPNEFDIRGNIAISKTAIVHPSAVIIGPVIIGHNTEVRPNAYIRGKVLIGNDCVIGNSCEFKNVIVFNRVQIPHFNYVGDSIIGYRSHLSAGVITSNLKSDQSNVTIKINSNIIETNLRKLGAIVGDCVEVGCNSVLNPGTVIGKNTNVYPLSSVRGYIPEDSIYKEQGDIIKKVLRR